MDEQKGCFSGCLNPGCAVLVFAFALVVVLLAEHTLHLFEGTFLIVVAVVLIGMSVAGALWIAKLVLNRAARGRHARDERSEEKS